MQWRRARLRCFAGRRNAPVALSNTTLSELVHPCRLRTQVICGLGSPIWGSVTEPIPKEHERLRPRTRGLSAAGLYGSPLLRPLRPALRRLKRSLLGRRVATSAWFPPNWRSTFRVCRILAVDYAHLRTAAVGRPMDAQGRPVPAVHVPRDRVPQTARSGQCQRLRVRVRQLHALLVLDSARRCRGGR